MRVARLGISLFALLAAKEARADQTLTFDGAVPTDALDHFFVAFQVPAGTQEIEILHTGAPSTNILDFGLNDENGYRGWGGGTSEDAIVGVNAASRAYVPGPITAGTWSVVVGKAKIVASPATYHIVVTIRTTPTLAPQTDRKPYVPSKPLETSHRYYACDFHVHDRESTDASPTLEANIQYAQTVGLDAIEASDHNTITQDDYITDLQAKYPKILIIPGIEWTSYHGHGNAMGALKWVDHKIGQPAMNGNPPVTIENQIAAVHQQQGVLFAINHPALDLGNLCIGCAWSYTSIDPKTVDAFEVESGGYKQAGFVFTNAALAMWDSMLGAGAHIAAIGGSDDHSGGDDNGPFKSAIGNPTTYVMADELTVAAILKGVKNGQTVVKMQDSHDPMIELTSNVPPVGDTVSAKTAVLQATITGGNLPGVTVEFVQNGVALAEVPVTSDPFTFSTNVTAPASGEDRWRVQLLEQEKPRVVTSHMFVRYDPKGPDGVSTAASEEGSFGTGGGCDVASNTSSGGIFAWLVAVGAVLTGIRRRR
ncbi:MAG: CehA/McbA family metallohydrolase [Polyangiaceae bacterium]